MDVKDVKKTNGFFTPFHGRRDGWLFDSRIITVIRAIAVHKLLIKGVVENNDG